MLDIYQARFARSVLIRLRKRYIVAFVSHYFVNSLLKLVISSFDQTEAVISIKLKF